jgi:hypothetical protein
MVDRFLSRLFGGEQRHKPLVAGPGLLSRLCGAALTVQVA